jgi:two-component sensor histidine kinase
VALGLILNETITNAIKYAFIDREQGVILVSLEGTQPGEALLTVSDNGRGLPPGFDISKATSLGLGLIQTLSEQLDGHMSIEDNDGVAVRIWFRLISREEAIQRTNESLV